MACRRSFSASPLLGALDRLGLGQRGPAGPLALTGEPGLLGGGLGGGDGGLPLRPRRGGSRRSCGPRPPARPGTARRRRACGPRCRAGARLSAAVRSATFSCSASTTWSCAAWASGPAAAACALAASISALISACLSASCRCAIGDRLLGEQPLLLGGLPGPGLGDRRLLDHPGRLRPAEVGEIGALGLDVLQLEGVEHQTLVGQRVSRPPRRRRRRTPPGPG